MLFCYSKDRRGGKLEVCRNRGFIGLIDDSPEVEADFANATDVVLYSVQKPSRHSVEGPDTYQSFAHAARNIIAQTKLDGSLPKPPKPLAVVGRSR